MSTDRPYGWMWLQALELVDQAERLQRRFLRYLGPRSDTPSWEPPVDIHESHEALVVLFALPGVLPEDITVELDDSALTVSAMRRVRCAAPDALIRRLEIPHGRFFRVIPLSGHSLKIAQSQYLNGCLEVRLVRTDREG
jgi:HSP20 family protein